MYLVDTHCHLTDKSFNSDREEVIFRAKRKDIAIVTNSIHLEDSKKNIKLAKKYLNVFSAIGFDPSSTVFTYYNEEDFEVLIENNEEYIVAIGEIGLEYYHLKNKEEQKEILVKQLNLANKYDLPVILHCRDIDGYSMKAYEDLLEILKENPVKKKGVIHSFSGNLEHAMDFTDMGYYLGVNGIISFNKSELLKEIVRYIDLSYLVLETDSPYLAPEPYRGKRNEPIFVEKVAEKLSVLKSRSLSRICENTTKNAHNLFNF